MEISFTLRVNPSNKMYAAIVFDIQEKEVITIYYNDRETLNRIAKNTYVAFWIIPENMDLLWLRQFEITEGRQHFDNDKYSKIFTKFLISKNKEASYDEIVNIIKEGDEEIFSNISYSDWKYSDKYQCMIYVGKVSDDEKKVLIIL